MAKVNAIKEDKSLDENTRNAMMMEAGTGMDSALILPFYIQETRDVALVTFDNEAYAAKITAATEADASAAYESRKVEFQTPQVKSAYIRIQTAGLEGEALQAKLDKAAQAEKRIKAGEDFSKVAQELSDSQVNEDQALYPITVHPEAIAAALKDLKVGAVTGIIDTEGYKHIFKVLERAEGKNFADVKESLIQELNADRMERMAAEDSAAFATKFSDEYWKSTSKADAQVDTAAMMKKLAAEFPMAKFSTASQVSPQDNSSYDQNLLYNVFKATMAAPLTGSISAAGASYNALLLGVTEGRLADPAADSSVYQVTLMPAYTNAVNTEDALLRANAEVKRMRNALTAKPGDLAAAAGNLKFQAMPAFSINDITTNAQNVQEIQKKFSINLNDLVPVLKNVTVAGGVLEPQLASLSLNYGRYSNISLGYQVLYVAERTVPQTEKAKLEEVRAQLLLSKQNEAMADFMQKLELESDTQLRPDTSYTSGLAN